MAVGMVSSMVMLNVGVSDGNAYVNGGLGEYV